MELLIENDLADQLFTLLVNYFNIRSKNLDLGIKSSIESPIPPIIIWAI